MQKISLKKVTSFFSNDIWYVKLEKFPRWQRGAIRLVRIVLLSLKDYTQKQLALRATALTLYTLLSIVPVIAMIFGIAKGFGLEAYLTDQLNNAFAAQPDVLNNLLNYVHNILGNSKGGVIAGFGFALLLWSVLQVLGNIEGAFNYIWQVQNARTWARKFTDYLSIMLVAPLFIIVSGAATVFISTQIQTFASEIAFLGSFIKNLIIVSINFLPYITTSLLFFLLYLVLPNTRVKPQAALYAGIVAGCIFQVFQWGYVEFQVGVSRYNAIYGSFASIPLFITWLQFSWMIVLVGAEISYSVQNITDFASEQQTGKISHKMRMLYSLHIIHFVTQKFKDAQQPADVAELSKKLEIPVGLVRSLLADMQKCGLIAQTFEQRKKEYCYIPALDTSFLTIGFIVNKLESLGELKRGEQTSKSFHQIKVNYNGLEKAMLESDYNKNILEV